MNRSNNETKFTLAHFCWELLGQTVWALIVGAVIGSIIWLLTEIQEDANEGRDDVNTSARPEFIEL